MHLRLCLPLRFPEISARKILGWQWRKELSVKFNSDYLIEKNWAQVCIMGEVTINYLDGFISDLREALRELY